MKPETIEWLDRAAGDLKVAERELAAEDPVPHVVCFLAQQAAEKHIKALMEERSLPLRKTHDLLVLIDQMTDLSAGFDRSARARIAELGTFGVSARYPGMGADMDAAREAVSTSRLVKEAITALLPPSNG